MKGQDHSVPFVNQTAIPTSISTASPRRYMVMRKRRELREDARYHVSARANNKEMILADGRIKELFLDVVKRAKRKFDFQVENFCIMGNHVHMIIRSFREFMAIFRYIDDNPVYAGQVDDRRKWMWGGLRHARIGCRDVVSGAAGYVCLLFPEHSQALLPGKD